MTLPLHPTVAAARLIGIPPWKLRRLTHEESLPHVRIGSNRAYYYDLDILREWVDAHPASKLNPIELVAMNETQAIVNTARKMGLSEQRIADICGVTRQAVWQWRAGKHEPRWSKIKPIIVWVAQQDPHED